MMVPRWLQAGPKIDPCVFKCRGLFTRQIQQDIISQGPAKNIGVGGTRGAIYKSFAAQTKQPHWQNSLTHELRKQVRNTSLKHHAAKHIQNEGAMIRGKTEKGQECTRCYPYKFWALPGFPWIPKDSCSNTPKSPQSLELLLGVYGASRGS
jgi:hypothetical protein